MKKRMLIMFLAMVAGAAFAQDANVNEVATDAGSSWGYVVAAVIAVINAVLSFFPNSKEAWWYKLLSWASARFGK